MNLSNVPTFVLQIFSLGSARSKRAVDARLLQRTAVCRRLFDHGELELLASLRRCEKMAIWIIGLMACVGGMVGWLAQDAVVGMVAVGLGVLVGAWLAGVMVDNVHALGQLVMEGRDTMVETAARPVGKHNETPQA